MGRYSDWENGPHGVQLSLVPRLLPMPKSGGRSLGTRLLKLGLFLVTGVLVLLVHALLLVDDTWAIQLVLFVGRVSG